MTQLAQFKQRDESDPNRYQLALDTLLLAEAEATDIINVINTAIAQHDELGKVLKQQAATNRNGGDTFDAPRDKDRKTSNSEDGEDDGIPQTAAGEEYRNKKLALRQRFRECQISMHKVQFIKGDIYHVLGRRYTDEENAAYAAAEDLRRVLLRSKYNSSARFFRVTSLYRHRRSCKARDESTFP